MQEAQEMWVQCLGQEDSLEDEMTTHSNILAWEIPWTEEPGRLQFIGSQRVKLYWTHTHTDIHCGLPEIILEGSAQGWHFTHKVCSLQLSTMASLISPAFILHQKYATSYQEVNLGPLLLRLNRPVAYDVSETVLLPKLSHKDVVLFCLVLLLFSWFAWSHNHLALCCEEAQTACGETCGKGMSSRACSLACAPSQLPS